MGYENRISSLTLYWKAGSACLVGTMDNWFLARGVVPEHLALADLGQRKGRPTTSNSRLEPPYAFSLLIPNPQLLDVGAPTSLLLTFEKCQDV